MEMYCNHVFKRENFSNSRLFQPSHKRRIIDRDTQIYKTYRHQHTYHPYIGHPRNSYDDNLNSHINIDAPEFDRCHDPNTFIDRLSTLEKYLSGII